MKDKQITIKPQVKKMDKLIKFVSENYPSLLKEVEKKLIKK